MAYERWRYDDPMLALERKQEREARSKGKRDRAKAGLQALFEGEAMTQDESQQAEELLQINTVETYSDKC